MEFSNCGITALSLQQKFKLSITTRKHKSQYITCLTKTEMFALNAL